MKKNETGPVFSTMYKNQHKKEQDLNVTPETVKMPEENIE